MSYREEYNKYIKRELNDSFIKDGRTIEYKPYYHSFNEWFEEVWKNSVDQVLKKVDRAIYDYYHIPSYLELILSLFNESKSDWNMFKKWCEDYNILHNEQIRSILTKKINLHDMYEDSMTSKEWEDKIKPDLFNQIKNDFNNWKLFDEWLKQDIIIWSEDLKKDRDSAVNKIKKINLIKESVSKFGKKDIYTMKYLEFKNLNSSGLDLLFISPYLKKIIIKEYDINNLSYVEHITEKYGWKVTTNLKSISLDDEIDVILVNQ